MRALLPASFAIALFATFGCTKILGIDKDYVEVSSTGSGAGMTTGSGGSGHTSSTTSGSGGTLSNIKCLAVSECPGVDTECAHRVCDSGFCGVAFTPAGTALGAQITGDCKKVTCDGQGLPAQIVDDTDAVDDSNPCTVDTCEGGVAKQAFAPTGTLCGNGLMCDSAGNCTGCTSPADCPGQDTECQMRACTSSICGFIRQPNGTAVSTQTAGDCKLNVCNNNGQINVIADADDAADDGNDCTADGCSNGSPTHVSAPAGAPCNTGKGHVCNGAGSCVECIDPSTCPGQNDECQTRTCMNGTCGMNFMPTGTQVLLQSPGDCKRNVCNGAGGITTAPEDTDLPNDGNPCTTDTCSGGNPVYAPVAMGTNCGAAKTCNASGQCQGCVMASDCPGMDNGCQTRTCSSGVCGMTYADAGTPMGTQTPGDCKKSVCDGAGAIVLVPDNDPADDGDECTSDVCSNGTLSHPPAPAGTLCGLGGYCNGAGYCGECSPGDLDFMCCAFNTGACCGAQAKPGPQTESAGQSQSDEAPDSECCCYGTKVCDSSGTWGQCN